MDFGITQGERMAMVDTLVMNQDMPIPLHLMKKYKEDTKVWPWSAFGADLGCGNGKKTAQMFEALDMGGFAFDVNPRFVSEASKKVLMAFQGDVTEPFFIDQMTIQNHMAEWYGTVNMGGLLVNVPGNRSAVLDAVDHLLTPGDHVFIAEVMRCDQYNEVMERQMGESNYHNFTSAWDSRYSNNEAVGLPRGTVVIAKPGSGRILEWGSPSDLLKILATAPSRDGIFERLVEHQSVDDLTLDLQNELGYQIMETRYDTVASRVKGQMYPIVVVVARKPEIFRYRSGYVGKHRSEILH